MNHTTAVFLVNTSVRAVAGIYEDDDNGKKTVPRTLFKTLDQTIKVGDFVLVPTSTRHKMSVNKIVEVDCDVDLESSVPMTWVIEVVDRSEFDATVKMEDDAIARIRSAEKRRKQDELRAALIKDNPILETLAISHMGGDQTADALVKPVQPPSQG